MIILQLLSLLLYLAPIAIGFYLLKRWRASSARKQEQDKIASSRELYENQKENKSVFNRDREPEIWQNVSKAIDSPHNDEVLRAMDEIDADINDNPISLKNGILIGNKWLKHQSYVVALDNIRVIFMDNSYRDKDDIRQIQIVIFTANPYISGHFLYEGYSYNDANTVADAVCSRAPEARFSDVTHETPERQHEIFVELDKVYPRQKA